MARLQPCAFAGHAEVVSARELKFGNDNHSGLNASKKILSMLYGG